MKRKLSEAAERRVCAEERAAYIAILGWAPETHGPGSPTSYAATTGELWRWALEIDWSRADEASERAFAARF